MKATRGLQAAMMTGLLGLLGVAPAAAQTDRVDFTITNSDPELTVTAAHLGSTGALAGQPVTAQMTIDLLVTDEFSQGMAVEVRAPKQVQVTDGARTYDVTVAMSDLLGTTDLDLVREPAWSIATMFGQPDPGLGHRLLLDLSAGPFTVQDPAGTYTGPLWITIAATNLDP